MYNVCRVSVPGYKLRLQGYESIGVPSGSQLVFLGTKLKWGRSCSSCRQLPINLYELQCHEKHAVCQRCLQNFCINGDVQCCPVSKESTMITRKRRNSRTKLQQEVAACGSCKAIGTVALLAKHLGRCQKRTIKRYALEPQNSGDGVALEGCKPPVVSESASVHSTLCNSEASNLSDVVEVVVPTVASKRNTADSSFKQGTLSESNQARGFNATSDEDFVNYDDFGKLRDSLVETLQAVVDRVENQYLYLANQVNNLVMNSSGDQVSTPRGRDVKLVSQDLSLISCSEADTASIRELVSSIKQVVSDPGKQIGDSDAIQQFIRDLRSVNDTARMLTKALTTDSNDHIVIANLSCEVKELAEELKSLRGAVRRLSLYRENFSIDNKKLRKDLMNRIADLSNTVEQLRFRPPRSSVSASRSSSIQPVLGIAPSRSSRFASIFSDIDTSESSEAIDDVSSASSSTNALNDCTTTQVSDQTIEALQGAMKDLSTRLNLNESDSASE